MELNTNTQALLLLTARFSSENGNSPKPLTPVEYGKFATWLKEKSCFPSMLVENESSKILNDWQDPKIEKERISGLLNRGSALALSVEKWVRNGLWILSRSDPDYPSRLKFRLSTQAPAILYGCGNLKLLNQGGLAVVGSRRATNTDLAFANNLGKLASLQGFSIVSGGARGIDEASMLGALDAEGTVVGVLAHELSKAITQQKYRNHLMGDSLVLVSAVNPEAGFSVGNAMARNKYIYCLSDAAMVVHSATKGGTWSGATETLRRDWVPVWVRESNDPDSGNSLLIEKGANSVANADGELQIGSLLNTDKSSAVFKAHKEEAAPKPQQVPSAKEPGISIEESDPQGSPTEDRVSADISFYDLFLLKAYQFCGENEIKESELTEQFQLKQGQVREWLARAVEEQKMERKTGPVRYLWKSQKELF